MLEKESFGVLLYKIGSNKVNLGIQTIIGLGSAALIEYFIFFKRTIDMSIVENKYLKMLPVIIVTIFLIYGLNGAIELIRNQVKIYERGLVVRTKFRKREIRNEQIDHFKWLITSYYAGFIPVGKRTECTIIAVGTQFKLAHLDSTKFSNLKKKITKLEERLEI